jgi:hypothetical protein
MRTWPTKVTNFVTLYHRHLDSSYFILLIESLNVINKYGYKIPRTHRHCKGGMLVSPIKPRNVTDSDQLVTLHHRHLCTSYFILLVESLNGIEKYGYKIPRSHRHWKGDMQVSPIYPRNVTDKVTNFVTLVPSLFGHFIIHPFDRVI